MGQTADPSRDQVVLLEASEPHREVSFPHSQAKVPHICQQLDGNLGVAKLERAETRSQDVAGQGLDSGHAHHPLQLRVAATDGALHAYGLGLDAFDLPQDRLASQRGHVAIGRAMEQPGSEAAFERGEAASDSRLGHPKLARGGRQATSTDDGQEKTEIVPIEHGDIRTVVGAATRRLWSRQDNRPGA
jgi:hypothetical protein